MTPEGILIDTGGIDKLLDPDTAEIKRFWDNFRDAQHFITPICYWEFLNQYDPWGHSKQRIRLMKLLENGRLVFLPFGQKEADLALRIFSKLKARVEALPKSKKRERLEHLQCDIFIAATAHTHRKRVFTMDTEDWQYIQTAIRDFHEQPLEVIFGDELIPAGKKRPKMD